MENSEAYTKGRDAHQANIRLAEEYYQVTGHRLKIKDLPPIQKSVMPHTLTPDEEEAWLKGYGPGKAIKHQVIEAKPKKPLHAMTKKERVARNEKRKQEFMVFEKATTEREEDRTFFCRIRLHTWAKVTPRYFDTVFPQFRCKRCNKRNWRKRCELPYIDPNVLS